MIPLNDVSLRWARIALAAVPRQHRGLRRSLAGLLRHLGSLTAAVALLAGGAFLLVSLIHSNEMSMKLLALVAVLVAIGIFALWEDFFGRRGH